MPEVLDADSYGTVVESVNWLLIVLCAVIVIITSFFLFFWNRLLGWIIGFILRSMFWKTNNIWIEFDAIQFSLLAGRVMIKELHYHSTNQSFRIIKCHITWRYWFWRARGESETGHVSLDGRDRHYKGKQLPCRLKVVAEGVEWFLYNRTPVYDEIIKHMTGAFGDPLSRTSAPSDSQGHDSAMKPGRLRLPSIYRGNRRPWTLWARGLLGSLKKWMNIQLPALEFTDILPINIVVSRGAIVMGNDSMPSIFIGDFKRATGTIGTVPSRSFLDIHKQIYALNFFDAKIFTRVNRDYDRPMRERGADIVSSMRRQTNKGTPISLQNFQFLPFHDLMTRLFTSAKPADFPPAGAQWHGLSRYYTQLDNSDRESSHEYAKLSTILETPTLEVMYYTDVAGLVPPNPRPTGMAGLETMDVGNGDLAPEWGIDFVLHGGQINYGPWIDRQRRALQEAFAPNSFQDKPPTSILRPGQSRMHVALKIFVELRDETTLRIPSREASKNWRYDAIGDLGPSRRGSRPFGWLDVKIGANSSINYVMSMVAHENGYDNMLQLHIDELSVLSSVNQSRFVFAESCRVLCEMPAPLRWNAERRWNFDVTLSRPVIHLLRDHVTLLTDLARDWISGPPTEFSRFVPITYGLKIGFKDVKLSLYVNDHNVIDFPLEDQQNALLTLSGPSILAEVEIPSTKYRPLSNSVTFSIEAPSLDVFLTLPSWNTHTVLATRRTRSVGRIGLIRVDSSYTYFSDVRPDNVDVLKLEINARSVLFRCFGWAIRHFMIVRDNYFGGFTNFATRTEYFAKKEQNSVGDPVDLKYRKGKSNIFQVSLVVDVQDAAILLPQELDDCQSATLISLPELQLILNLHDHFMDMTLNTHPLHFSACDDCSTIPDFQSVPHVKEVSLILGAIDINANRLFGPQPRAATYLCVWEIQLGDVTGSFSPKFSTALMASISSFLHNMKDSLNAPAAEYRLFFDPDVTFLKVELTSVDLTLRTLQSSVRCLIPQGLQFDTNDLAGREYRSVKSLSIPMVRFQCLLARPEEESLFNEWFEVAGATFDAYLDIYSTPPGWREDALQQTLFVTSQDKATRRATFLYEVDQPRDLRGYQRDHALLLPRIFIPGSLEPHTPSSGKEISNESQISLSEVSTSSDASLYPGYQDLKLAHPKAPFMAFSGQPGHSRMHNPFVDADISSGDESDDGDETDSTSSDVDDPSDYEDHALKGEETSIFWPYRQVLRRYRTAKSSPSLNSGFPVFALGDRGRDPFISFAHAYVPDSPDDQVSSAAIFPDADVNSRAGITTLIRLASRRPNDFMLTPLVKDLVEDIHQELEQSIPSLEQSVDQMFVSMLSAFPAPMQVSKSTTAFEARLFLWRVSTWQPVSTFVASKSSLSQEGGKKAPSSSDGSVLSLMALRMTSGFCTGFVCSDGSLDVRAEFGSTGVEWQRHYHSVAPDLSGDLTVGSSFIHVERLPTATSISPYVGDIQANFSDSIPEVMHGVLNSYSACFTDIRRSINCRRDRTVRNRQLILRNVLDRQLRTSAITDPLSWTQVSFMVKSGRPHLLRSDPSFTLLANIRMHLHRLSAIELRELTESVRDTSSMADTELLSNVAQLIKERSIVGTLDVDADDVEELRLLKCLFPSITEHTSIPTSSLAPSIVVSLGSGRLVIKLGRKGESTELSVGPGALRIRAGLRSMSTNIATPGLGSGYLTTHVTASCSVADVSLDVHPASLSFARNLLRLRRSPMIPSIVVPSPEYSTFSSKEDSLPSQPIVFEIVLNVERIESRAAAQLLSFGSKIAGLRVILSGLFKPAADGAPESKNVSISATLRDFIIQARATEEQEYHTPERAVLASLILRGVRVYLSTDGTKLYSTVGTESFSFTVPRSAIKLYRFVQEWQTEYLPAYNTMFRGLLSEMEQPPSTIRSPPGSKMIPMEVDLQVRVRFLNVSLHIMHGTWLSWGFHDFLAFSHTTDMKEFPYGIMLASQVISLSSSPDGSSAVSSTSDSSVKLELPSFKLSGCLRPTSFTASLVVDRFKVMLKPQYVDDILVVQQKFGTDFNEIVDIFAQTRRQKHPKRTSSPLVMNVSVRLDGFTIGVRGPTSVQYLDSPLVHGTVVRSESNAPVLWHLKMSDLALSLAHDSSLPAAQSPPYRSAYMIMDCIVNNDPPADQVDLGDADHLNVIINKIQALMMPAAIGELGDLIDHVQAEMLQRKEQRAFELEEMKKKTQHVIRSFESSNPPRTTSMKPSNRIISLAVKKIGIVFPLTNRTEIVSLAPRPSSPSAAPKVPAFLVSITSLDFVTQRNETGNARMRNFAFQFIPSFDQSKPEQFESISHDKFNRMMYPEMSAEVHSQASASSRRVWVRAAVSGFELDIAPSLAGHIFSLIDVYREGKEQFGRFALQARAGVDPTKEVRDTANSIDSSYSALPTSDIRLSLEFQSGQVRFHSPDELRSAIIIAPLFPTDPGLADFSHSLPIETDLFRLPTVSVWLEYHATPASQKRSTSTVDGLSSSLTFSVVVHSSRNTVSPSILPFLTDFTRQVEDWLATDSSARRVSRIPAMPNTPGLNTPQASGLIKAMEITFSLRIDQSHMEFTCLPDVNVSSGLHWTSGGFFLRISPGAKEVALIGSIEGITANLRHGYLVEDCVNAGAQDLSFSMTFSMSDENDGLPLNSLSLVVNTQVEGSVRFGRLQDILCFKAVWLDRIPVFEGITKATTPPPPDTPRIGVSTEPPSKGFITSVLVQVKSLRLEVDLGQSITKLILDLRPVVARTRLTNAFSEISLSAEQVTLKATRAISGIITLPQLTFETIRRRKDSEAKRSTLLELKIRSGELNGMVEYEGKRILLLRATPMEATVFDDWTAASSSPSQDSQQIQLHFAVRGGELRAGARIMTISELIIVGGKVTSLILAQKEGAARESKAFRATQSPKPRNPLSDVATAMLESARSKLMEKESTQFVVIQHMHLYINQIQLSIFNQADTRMTQFEAVGVQGDLIRNVESQHQSPFRDLNLALQSFEVRGGDMPALDKWLDHHPGAKVFTMPEMNISMQSTEHANANRLDYDFRSTFPRPRAKSGAQTLYIALDFHKYEQLMAMQNTFRQEIERALAEVAPKKRTKPLMTSFTIAKAEKVEDTVSPSIPAALHALPFASEPFSQSSSSMAAAGSEGSPSRQSSAEPGTAKLASPVLTTDESTAPDMAKVEVGIRGLTYHCISRSIETPKLHQLGAASPDLETFKQWTNISIRDSLPVWIHEYATVPIEQLMKVLLEVYLKQLKEKKMVSGDGGGEAAA